MCNDNPIKCSPVDEDGNITQTVSRCGDPNKWALQGSLYSAGDEGLSSMLPIYSNKFYRENVRFIPSKSRFQNCRG